MPRSFAAEKTLPVAVVGESLDLGRLWQVLPSVGLFFWVAMLFRGSRGRLRREPFGNMPRLFFYSAGSMRGSGSSGRPATSAGRGRAISGPGVTALPACSAAVCTVDVARLATCLTTAGAGAAATAPASKPVTGETALVGVFKAFPVCSAGQALDPRRTRLAYAQLNATADLAADGSDMTRASAVFLQALRAVVVGQAADAPAIESALNSAASQQGITMSDSTSGEMIGVLEQVRELDYGRYAHGYSIEELGQDQVRVVARE